MTTNKYRMGAAPGAAPTPDNQRRNKKASTLQKRRGRAGLWFVMPWIIGFFLWFLIPMIASLWFSFTDFSLVSDEGINFIGLDNWRKLFNDPEVANSAMVTLKFSLYALPFAIFFPMVLAYIMVSKSLRWKEGFRALQGICRRQDILKG